MKLLPTLCKLNNSNKQKEIIRIGGYSTSSTATYATCIITNWDNATALNSLYAIAYNDNWGNLIPNSPSANYFTVKSTKTYRVVTLYNIRYYSTNSGTYITLPSGRGNPNASITLNVGDKIYFQIYLYSWSGDFAVLFPA